MVLFNLPNYQQIEVETPAYEIDYNTAGTVYMRWQNETGDIVIKKVVSAANVDIITFAYDTWLNVATATYYAYLDFMAAGLF